MERATTDDPTEIETEYGIELKNFHSMFDTEERVAEYAKQDTDGYDVTVTLTYNSVYSDNDITFTGTLEACDEWGFIIKQFDDSRIVRGGAVRSDTGNSKRRIGNDWQMSVDSIEPTETDEDDNETDEEPTNPDEWWNEERSETWKDLDLCTLHVQALTTPKKHLPRGVSLHTAAPNPLAIDGDEKPDEWHVSVSHDDTEVDIEEIADILATETGCDVDIRTRPDGWEDGYWLVVEGWDSEDTDETDEGTAEDTADETEDIDVSREPEHLESGDTVERTGDLGDLDILGWETVNGHECLKYEEYGEIQTIKRWGIENKAFNERWTRV